MADKSEDRKFGRIIKVSGPRTFAVMGKEVLVIDADYLHAACCLPC